MPELTHVELKRLYHLRDIVFPLAAAKHEAGLLNFDIFANSGEPHSCQTAHCLFGWAMLTPELQADGFCFDRDGDPYRVDSNGRRESVGFRDIADYYGISYGEADFLFGGRARGDALQDLIQRLQMLDRIILEKEGRHV